MGSVDEDILPSGTEWNFAKDIYISIVSICLVYNTILKGLLMPFFPSNSPESKAV